MTDWLITDPHSRQSAAAAVTKWTNFGCQNQIIGPLPHIQKALPVPIQSVFWLSFSTSRRKKSVRVSESLTPNRVCQLPNKFALLSMPDQQHQPTFCSSLELASNFAKPWPNQFYFCYCYTQQKIFRSPPIIPETYSTLFLPSET